MAVSTERAAIWTPPARLRVAATASETRCGFTPHLSAT